MSRLGICSVCEKILQLGKGSRAEGNVCRECRRTEPGKYKYEPRTRPNKPRNRIQPEPVRVTCSFQDCGREFTPSPKSRYRLKSGKPVYCSSSCAGKANSRIRHPNGPGPKSSQSSKAANRRRRMVVAATWDGVTDQQILDRDKWTCWICKRHISKTYKHPHPRSASIDHLIPLSLGGDDTEFNKKAAHLRCNMSRGTGRAGEHPMLNFSLDPNVEIKPRTTRKPCGICGETPNEHGKCNLHALVWYVTCQACGTLSVTRRKGARTCGAPECKRTRMYASHDRAISERPAHKRGMQAHVMHEAGNSWDEIADVLGYSAGNYAAAAAARALGSRSARKQGEYERTPRRRETLESYNVA